jgi:PGF-pre-PGF domain-containing protein
VKLKLVLVLSMLFCLAFSVNAYNCWEHDSDETACQAAITSGESCEWEANNQNQNPWCNNDVGCCDQKGCWSYDNTNQNTCESALNGMCTWATSETDPYCMMDTGCCIMPWCGSPDVVNNETKCETLSAFMPCAWESESCTDAGCAAWNNESDTCMMQNWCQYNPTTGACSPNENQAMNEVHCWFADNQPSTCLNITGCVYCDDADSETNNVSSMCYNNPIGFCQGHEQWPFATDGATDEMECSDILLKKTCLHGPLQPCTWNATGNSTVGNYCTSGDSGLSSSITDGEGNTVKFCEDAVNSGNCTYLIEEHFLPCVWNATETKCKFKGCAGGGDKSDNMNFAGCSDQKGCNAGGGKFNEKSYCDDGAIITESWCESGFGKGWEQCDDGCWACEWQDDGSSHASASAAETACGNSNQNCEFTAFASQGTDGRFGECHLNAFFASGNSFCDSNNCGSCDYSKEAQTSCENLEPDCKWTGSNCISGTEKTCNEKCSECESAANCADSSVSCMWDNNNNLCKAQGQGNDMEICNDGIDNNNNNQIDCKDPQCSFSAECGGGMIEADCYKKTAQNTCEATSAFGGQNCTWINTTWGVSWCGMPGEGCWFHDDNMTQCSATAGCSWFNTTEYGYDMSCNVNSTLDNVCHSLSSNTTCLNQSGCYWVSDEYSGYGFCEPALFEACFQYDFNQTACNEHNDTCFWIESEQLCDPVCFGLNSTTCGSNWMCEADEDGGFCEPEFGMSHCPDYDGNQSACNENPLCDWIADEFSPETGDNSGWCNDMFAKAMFEEMDPSPPMTITVDVATDVAHPEQDLREIAVKVMPDGYMFGLPVTDFSYSAACKDYYTLTFAGNQGEQTDGDGISTGTNTTKFWLYLDTDDSETGGCTAYTTESSEVGFEFKLEMISEYEDGAVVETKKIYNCEDSSWSETSESTTNMKNKMCNMVRGGMLGVQKESLKNYPSLYSTTANFRLLGCTGGADNSSTDPSDCSSIAYLNPGSVDWKAEDCFAPGADMDGDGITSENDPDCEKFKSTGYIDEQDCLATTDTDGDGVAGCADSDCYYNPKCEDASNKFDPTTDKVAPKVEFERRLEYPDSAHIITFTNEPALGSLLFYGTDSTCTTLNATIQDTGSLASNEIADYRKPHNFPITDDALIPQRLDAALTNATTYYYKTQLSDIANNSGISSCLNFTTTATAENTNCPDCKIIFDFQPAGANMLYNFNDGDNWTSASSQCGGLAPGFMKWYNQTRKMSMKFNSSTWALGFINFTLPTRESLYKFEEISASEIKDDNSGHIGLGSETWKKMVTVIDPEWVTIKYASASCTSLFHCNDAGTSCTDLSENSDISLVSSAGGYCEWMIPPWGFSTYGSSNLAASSSSSTSSSTSSSSGGGSSASYSATEPGEVKVSMTWEELKKNANIDYKITKTTMPVRRVKTTALLDLGTTTLEVSTKPKNPTSVETNSVVYEYLEIYFEDKSSEALDEGLIEFRVEKEWINTSKEDIVLLRFKDNKWNNLETEYVEDDSKYYYYTASTPGFSFFAISTRPEKPQEPIVETPKEIKTIEPQKTIETIEEPEEKKESNGYIGLSIFMIVIIVIAVGALVFMMTRKPKEPQEKKIEQHKVPIK